MRDLNKLTSLAVKNAPNGKFGDGGGLWLRKSGAHSGKWVFLYTIGGRRESSLEKPRHALMRFARQPHGCVQVSSLAQRVRMLHVAQLGPQLLGAAKRIGRI